MTRTARRTGFLKRERTIEPQALVLSLIAALSKGNCHAIADLHRQFNGMSLSEKQSVAYKPFHIDRILSDNSLFQIEKWPHL